MQSGHAVRSPHLFVPLPLCPSPQSKRESCLAAPCPRQLVKRSALLSPLAPCPSHVAKHRRHIRVGIRSEACGRMKMATFSHRRSVLSMLCLTMQQQQRRSAQHQRHRSHRWNAQLLQQHLKARISLWISATQTQACRDFYSRTQSMATICPFATRLAICGTMLVRSSTQFRALWWSYDDLIRRRSLAGTSWPLSPP